MVTKERYEEHKRWRSHGYTAGQACTMVRAYDTAHYVHRGGITPRLVHYRQSEHSYICYFTSAASLYASVICGASSARIAYKQACWRLRMSHKSAEEREALFWDHMGYHCAVWENW